MNNAQFALVLVSLIGGIIAILRTLWNIRGGWDDTNAQIKLLVNEVRKIAEDNKEEHGRIWRWIERHEDWHRNQWRQ